MGFTIKRISDLRNDFERLQIWNLWNFYWMFKYVTYMIIRITICTLIFDYTMTSIMKGDDKDV